MPHYFTTAQLAGVVKTGPKVTPFWLHFFGESKLLEAQEIAWDYVYKDMRGLAHFVPPDVEAVVNKHTGFETRAFLPAFMKEKDAITARTNLTERTPGEPIGSGNKSPEQRRIDMIADFMLDHRTKITNTFEYMSARAVIDGKLTVVGDRHPVAYVDFKRDSSLTYTLVGGAQWSMATAKPIDDIAAAMRNSNALCSATHHSIIFDMKAWAKFAKYLKDTDTKLINRDYRGSTTSVSLLPAMVENGVQYMGQVSSEFESVFDCYVCSGGVIDVDGTFLPFMEDNTVVGVCPQMLMGTRIHTYVPVIGEDGSMHYVVDEFVPSHFVNNDPPAEFIMTQSAGLVIPVQPNATFKINVG